MDSNISGLVLGYVVAVDDEGRERVLGKVRCASPSGAFRLYADECEEGEDLVWREISD